MRKWQPTINPACCLYCKQELIIKGKQRWHNCAEAIKIKREEWKLRHKNRDHKRNFKKYENKPVGLKLCKKCKTALTVNYFGVCDTCRSAMSSQYDWEMMIGFEQGSEKRNGVRIW